MRFNKKGNKKYSNDIGIFSEKIEDFKKKSKKSKNELNQLI